MRVGLGSAVTNRISQLVVVPTEFTVQERPLHAGYKYSSVTISNQSPLPHGVAIVNINRHHWCQGLRRRQFQIKPKCCQSEPDNKLDRSSGIQLSQDFNYSIKRSNWHKILIYSIDPNIYGSLIAEPRMD